MIIKQHATDTTMFELWTSNPKHPRLIAAAHEDDIFDITHDLPDVARDRLNNGEAISVKLVEVENE